MKEDRRQRFSNGGTTAYQKVMNTAVRILAHRDHSKYELKQKLQRRDFESKVIETVIAECERLDYINDPRTARRYILELKRKGFGRRHIRMALQKKHLGGAAIEALVVENYPESEERQNADNLLEKKRQTFWAEEDPEKRRKKMYRFLYARGFGTAVISDLIRELVK